MARFMRAIQFLSRNNWIARTRRAMTKLEARAAAHSYWRKPRLTP
jgi:hypothetical protein